MMMRRIQEKILKRIINLPTFYTFSFNPIKVPNLAQPLDNSKNILITAALPYVNNTPHLGNIIGGVLSADVYARYCRMRGYNVIFVCGTDQYGTTTEVKALQQKISPQEICDKYHNLHKGVYEWFNIQFDSFGRTSHPLHSSISLQILEKISSNGYIKHKREKHFYCQSCHMSLADRYVKGECSNCGSSKAKGDQCDDCSTVFKDPIVELNNPRCAVCSQTPTTRDSEHLYLKLPELSVKLQEWLLKQNGMANWSHNAKAVTRAWLINKLCDRCITRDLNWGVKVPSNYFTQEMKKVLYVWFEAPLGYISMTASLLGENWLKWWQPDENKNVELTQFMGKDNIVFHSTMAPATLMGTGDNYVRPKRLSVTQYLMYEGGKFSKSNNIGVFGNDCQQTAIKSDVWRYYLLSNRPEHFDNQFTWEGLATRNNKDLLNSLGNMVNRVLKYAGSKFGGKVPVLDPSSFTQLENCLLKDLQKMVKQYCQFMQNIEIKNSASKLIQITHTLNKYLQDSEFWSKQNIQKQRNKVVIALMVRVLDFYAILMRPFLPESSQKLLKMLVQSKRRQENVGFDQQTLPWELLMRKLTDPKQLEKENQKWEKIVLEKPQVLFQEISQAKVKAFAQKYGVNKAKKE